MNILGIIYNFFSIALLGIYDPVNYPDGVAVMEDSAIYDMAFELAYMLGTIS